MELQFKTYPTPLPHPGKPCLCFGHSYDTGGAGGYFVAEVVAGEWLQGKQQAPVSVISWAELPEGMPIVKETS